MPSVAGLAGRSRKRPVKLPADKGYDYPCHRRWLRRRGIAVRIARHGVESHERLGRWRGVVKRTLGWLHRFRPCTFVTSVVQILAIAKSAGISLKDLLSNGGGSAPRSTKGSLVPVRCRHPSDASLQ